jgi:Raf kinase inhibitor-like YbhB/YbcL family protein
MNKHYRHITVPHANENRYMHLESSAFADRQLIPSLYTCDGADQSPPLSWGDLPSGTVSLALICDDPDAPGKTWVHWVMYNLPPELGQLPAAVPPQAELVNGGVQGKNDFGYLGYGGPCPPAGVHRYFFKLYALDRRLDLKPGAPKVEVERAMTGHILAQAELVGRYQRSRS